VTERIPQIPPVILPVSDHIPRPFWSVMIPTYNSTSYLREALESVLMQDPGPAHMQIEVVDDHSLPEDPRKLVEELGGSRISYFRQPENRGSLRNFETCLGRARGRWVHLLHGDDRVRNGFYSNMEGLIAAYPEAGAACCRFAYIDSGGKTKFDSDPEQPGPGLLDHWLSRLGERQRQQVAATVVRRDVYEYLGGFYGVDYGEDWLMWMRVASRYPVAYCPEILADYRIHPRSISGRSFRTGQNMRDLNWVMQTVSPYFADGEGIHVQHKARRFYAHYAVRTANSLWVDLKDSKAAKIQIREALKMHWDPALCWEIGIIYLKMGLHYG